MGALGFHHCHCHLEAGEAARACWGAVEAAGPVRRWLVGGWKALEACCSEAEEAEPLPCGWRACCPLAEVVEGVCHPGPCLGWEAGEACWRRAKESLRGTDVWSFPRKWQLGFQGRGEGSERGQVAWGSQGLVATRGCADLIGQAVAY